MDIVAALFIEGIDLSSAFPGGPTKIDLTGVHFSATPPSPPPVTLSPHMIVLVRCAEGEDGNGVLEVVFRRAAKPGDEGGDEGGEGEHMARNVQPLQLEPGKFTYRLVRAELELDDYGTIEAHCRIGGGPTTVVPYTLVPGPAAEAAPPITPAGE